MTFVIPICLVKLRSGNYSVPRGSLGYVSDTFPPNACSWEEVDSLAISWAEQAGPGGGSVPVLVDDVEVLGNIRVKIPQSVADDIIRNAQIDIPDWLINDRARKLVTSIMHELHLSGRAAKETSDA